MKSSHASALLLCLLLAPAQADERRQSGTDTGRHVAPRAAPSAPASAQRLRRQSVRRSVDDRTLLEDIDPAVRQYWSQKCVQQRARGWGHTGDCNHPAYSGGYDGRAPLVVPYDPRGRGYPSRIHPEGPYRLQAEPSRRRGHLGVQPPRKEGRGHLR